MESIRIGDLKSILQVIPEKTPGNFVVWYHSSNRIQQLQLTLKRKYYVKGVGGLKKAPREEGEAMETVID